MPASSISCSISYPCCVVNPCIDLDAPPMPVHVAEAAGIHQYVESELLPRAESSQHLVMLAAMPHPQIDNLPPTPLSRRPAPPAESAGKSGDSARTAAWSPISTSSGSSSSKSTIAFEGASGSAAINSARCLSQLASRLHLICIRVGILHQRRSHSHLAQQLLLRPRPQFRHAPPESARPIPATIPVHVISRARAAFFSDSPSARTSRCVCDSKCATCVLQRSRIHDLAQRSIGRQRQQVSRDVKRPRPQRPLVRILLHILRAWE